METQTGHGPQNNFRSTGLKILSAVGFILVLVFGAWGVIQVGRSLSGVSSFLSSAAVSLSSIFVPAERLSINVPTANINSGEPFTFSWTHTNKRSTGTYTVTFGCSNGLTMQTIGENGVYQSVTCNTPFNFTNATNEMTFVATSNTARFLDVPFTVEFTRLSDGTVSASAKTTLTITNSAYVEPGSTIPTTILPQGAQVTPSKTTQTPSASVPTTPAATTPAPAKPAAKKPVVTTTYATVGPISNPNGNPDLAVTILDVGTISQYNGYFVSNNTVRKGDTVAVRFVVENTGNKIVDMWNFNAVLPTMPMNIYSSEMQPPLMPGDKMQYTVQFDKVDSAATNGAFTINVDPSNMIWNELNKNNNVAKVYLTILNN